MDSNQTGDFSPYPSAMNHPDPYQEPTDMNGLGTGTHPTLARYSQDPDGYQDPEQNAPSRRHARHKKSKGGSKKKSSSEKAGSASQRGTSPGHHSMPVDEDTTVDTATWPLLDEDPVSVAANAGYASYIEPSTSTGPAHAGSFGSNTPDGVPGSTVSVGQYVKGQLKSGQGPWSSQNTRAQNPKRKSHVERELRKFKRRYEDPRAEHPGSSR